MNEKLGQKYWRILVERNRNLKKFVEKNHKTFVNKDYLQFGIFQIFYKFSGVLIDLVREILASYSIQSNPLKLRSFINNIRKKR